MKKEDIKILEAFKMWTWRRMEKVEIHAITKNNGNRNDT